MKYRVLKKHIGLYHKDLHICKSLCLKSKSLRNVAIEIITKYHNKHKTYQLTPDNAKQYGINTDKNTMIYSMANLYHMVKNTPEFRCEVNTKALKQTLKSVNEEFTSYRKALTAYYQDSSKFKAIPQPPGFKNEKQQYKITFPADAVSCNKKKRLLSLGNTGITIGMANIFYEEKVREIEIIPTRCGYILNINLEDNRTFVSVKDNSKLSLTDTGSSPVSYSPKRILSIDLGIKHIATMVCNDLLNLPKSFVTMVGTGLNYINRKTWFRTDTMRLRLNDNIKDSKEIQLHEDKRSRRMDTLLHTYSKRIVEYCLVNGIGTVVCGNNPGWKQNVNLGKETNRKFYGIPYFKFLRMLMDKLERHSIKFVIQEESYTSKCSFLDNEDVCKHEKYVGKRKSRGLFVSGKGIRINADVNGALNIMRKYIKQDIFHHNRNCYATLNPVNILPHVKLLAGLEV